MRKNLLLGLTLSATAIIFPQQSIAAAPSNAEQLWLETINRFRANPRGELDILTKYVTPETGTVFANPKSHDPDVASALTVLGVSGSDLRSQFSTLTSAPPLAWNSNLHAAALGHTNAMIAAQTQSHQLPGEAAFAQRLTNAGYTFTLASENIFALTHSVFHGHAGLVIDWGATANGIQNPPGHRNALINATFREIGISLEAVNDPGSTVGPLVATQDLARRAGNAYLTGVAFTDLLVQDAFYTMGEGLGGIAVNVFDAARTSLVAATTTFGSGGYSLSLAAGTYDVQFTGGGNNFVLDDYSFASGENQKLDFITGTVPEPTQVVLMVLGLIGLLARSRCVRRRAAR